MSHREGRRQNRKGKQWTQTEIQRLKKLANGNTPTRLIADALNRTEDAVRNKASEKNVSLMPSNRSPYSRRRRGG